MQYHLDENKNLVITANEEDKKELQELKSEYDEKGMCFGCDDALYAAFENLICNSELQWSDASTIGALTSAPILAIFGEEIEIEPDSTYREHGICYGYQITGQDCNVFFGQKVVQAWAYMDYCVRSPQQDLLEYGKAVFQLGWDTEETESTDEAVDE
jgi:hypothetical protein